MKLLLDQNLSRRIVPFLQKDFPGSTQTALAGLDSASDLEIWRYAQQQACTIVSQDADFADLSASLGAPPCVIWLRTGNLDKSQMLAILLRHKNAITAAFEQDGKSLIEIWQQDGATP